VEPKLSFRAPGPAQLQASNIFGSGSNL